MKQKTSPLPEKESIKPDLIRLVPDEKRNLVVDHVSKIVTVWAEVHHVVIDDEAMAQLRDAVCHGVFTMSHYFEIPDRSLTQVGFTRPCTFDRSFFTLVNQCVMAWCRKYIGSQDQLCPNCAELLFVIQKLLPTFQVVKELIGWLKLCYAAYPPRP